MQRARTWSRERRTVDERYPESVDACLTSWSSSQPPGAMEPSGSGSKTRLASAGYGSVARTTPSVSRMRARMLGRQVGMSTVGCRLVLVSLDLKVFCITFFGE